MKNAFKFPMQTSERVAGLVYLAVHACVLPWLVAYVYTAVLRNMDVVLTGPNLNLIYYIISFTFVMIFMFRYLKASFSDLADNLPGSLKAIVLSYLFNYAALILVSLFLSAVLENAANPNSQEIMNQTKLDPNAVIVCGGAAGSRRRGIAVPGGAVRDAPDKKPACGVYHNGSAVLRLSSVAVFPGRL